MAVSDAYWKGLLRKLSVQQLRDALITVKHIHSNVKTTRSREVQGWVEDELRRRGEHVPPDDESDRLI